MSREWKPGDVAVAWINDRRELALVRPRQEAGIKGGLEFAYVNGGFDMVDDLAPGWDARPLVVIDPEDREQVQSLWLIVPNYTGTTVEQLQNALRKFADPKPPEPTGLGAVVEDAEGRWWSRLGGTTDLPWHHGIEGRTDYDNLAAVKVLSEGVTP